MDLVASRSIIEINAIYTIVSTHLGEIYMNKVKLILLNLFILLSGCKNQIKRFHEPDSLIELNAIRQKDLINDFSGYRGMSTKDGQFWDNVYPEIKGIPDSLVDVKLYFTWFNNIQALYQSYKAGKVDEKSFDYFYNSWSADTTNCISDYVKTFVVIATGTSKTGQRYYIFDSDNDFYLGDEPLYETSILNPAHYGNNNKEFQPHKVIYEKVINHNIRQDSTWIAFYENSKGMWIQFCEKASVTFQFDTVIYRIDTRPDISLRYRGGTQFNISNGFNKRSKNYKEGEYLKLGNSFYKLSCSSDGLKISLTKNSNAWNYGSTQIGMCPIQFAAKTLNGDTINFPSDFKGKYVLLDFWAVSCAPCIQEIKNYYLDIYKRFGGSQFEIIGVADNTAQELEKFINKNRIKWIIIPDREKKILQNKYNITHYPTLYFINPKGVIIAKEDELREGQFVSILDENIKVD